MIVFKVKNVEAPKTFEGDGYELIANEHSCAFCSHCSDIFYDFTNGPYWFYCDIKNNFCADEIEPILQKGCPDYE